MFFFKLGIYDNIRTDIIKIPIQKINNHMNVYLIYFLVYGLIKISLFVHCQGGQFLENKHHTITNTIIKPKIIITIINGINNFTA